MNTGSSPSPHPALQLNGELGLKLAGGSFTVVSLDEDFVGQGSTVPQLLQVMELKDDKSRPQRRFVDVCSERRHGDSWCESSGGRG